MAVAMAEIVEADARQIELGDEFPERARQRDWTPGAAVAHVADEIVVLKGRAKLQPASCLLGPVLLQGRDGEWRQRD